MTAPARRFENGGFVLFLALTTVGLALVVQPFAAALLWSVLAAVIFQPLYLRCLGWLRGHESGAALLALAIITVAVIVPAAIIATIVIDQATAIYLSLQDRAFEPALLLDRALGLLPASARDSLNASGFGEVATIVDRISALVRESTGIIAKQALAIGGGALSFVLSFGVALYVTYFLLRDGRRIGQVVTEALPLDRLIAQALASRFVTVIRATIKGSIVVGLVQGALGAITFWIAGVPAAALLGVLMALFSLLPAVGPAIIWAPVAIYLFATGLVWQGVVVVVSGVLVVGLADNLLRPILVGRDTGIPDWIVLVTTLGGIAVFGLSGIVLGPLVAGLFLAGWAILREERQIAAPEEPEPAAESA